MKKYLLLFISITLCIPTHSLGNSIRNTLQRSMESDDISVIATNPTTGRRLGYSFTTNGFPYFRLSRLTETPSQNEFAENADIAGVTFRIGFLTIIEYKESNIGQSGFDATDTVISQMPLLSDIPYFTPLTETSDIGDDTTYYIYRTSVVNPTSCFDSHGSIFDTWTGVADLRGYITSINRTLSPDGWKWGLSITGYPYKENKTRLAIKAVLETGVQMNYNDDPPISERYDTTTNMVGIQFIPSKGTFQSVDQSDIGYFVWEQEAGVTTCSQTGYCTEQDIDITATNILPPEKDILMNVSSFDYILDDTDYGRIPTEQRNFIYFSFPIDNPCVIQWDPVIAMDVTDSSTTSSSTHSSSQPQIIWITIWMITILFWFQFYVKQ